jgi:hypothetical protein
VREHIRRRLCAGSAARDHNGRANARLCLIRAVNVRMRRGITAFDIWAYEAPAIRKAQKRVAIGDLKILANERHTDG